MNPGSRSGFFDSASVNRFSICFNHKADGVLGINTPSHLDKIRHKCTTCGVRDGVVQNYLVPSCSR